MPLNTEETSTYRNDVKTKGKTLSRQEREKLIKQYLPTIPDESANRRLSSASQKQKPGRRRRVRPFIAQKLHFLIYLTIQFIFGIYIRFRQIVSALFQKFIAIRHYHHRTPAYIQRDIRNLSRLPEHLSVVLRCDISDDGALEALLDEVAELSAWTTAAGIPLLSVYEKTGILKQYISALQELVHQKLVLYYGSPPATPTVQVFAPNLANLSPIPTSLNQTNSVNDSTLPHLNLLLLSYSDGRDTLVDLTRTLTEMSQSRKLRPKDITADLIDTEISATTSIPSLNSPSQSPRLDSFQLNGNADKPKYDSVTPPTEPDLLIVFSPTTKLDGYPPWQLRLTEIFCVGDSGGDVSGRNRTRVEYQGFLRALWKYAGAQFRFGR